MPESAQYARRGVKGAARATTLVGAINDAVLSIGAADLSTWAGVTTNGPATATIDMGTTSEETIEFTGITGNTLTGVTRGVGGTTARTHADNAPIVHSSQVRDYDEANQAVASVLGANPTVVLLAGAQTITGTKTFTAADSRFGTGAAGAAGTFTRIGDLGNANNSYVTAEGSGANVGLGLRPKGTSSIRFENPMGGLIASVDPNGTFQVFTDPGSGTQSGVIVNFSFIGARRLEVGAVDSAGTGFRTVRIPN